MKKIRCSTTKYLFIHKLSRLAIATTTAGMCSVQYGKRYRNHTHLYMCLSKGIVTDLQTGKDKSSQVTSKGWMHICDYQTDYYQ